MPLVFYDAGQRKVTIEYDFDLTPSTNVPISQFQVVNTAQNIFVAIAYTQGKLLVLELGGDVPSNDFGIVYTPGSSGFLTRLSDGASLGQIYYSVDIENGGICIENCDNIPDIPLPPVSIQQVTCLDENTIEVKYTRYLSTNSIPPLSSFVLLDVPENAAGNFTQVSISGFSVLLEHNFDFPLSGTSLQYLPPSTNFLQTSDTPPVLILPFIVPIACGDGVEPCDIQDKVHKNGIVTGYGTQVGELASIQDYVLIYGIQEAIQASNDDNGGATTINELRLQAELDHAAIMLSNYIQVATWSGKALLAGSFKRTQLVIARYYLLNKSRPEVVREEFERTLSWIDAVAYSNANKPDPNCNKLGGGTGGFLGTSDGFHSGGRVMSWGITQQYRTDDGLGLRGWSLPTDGQDHLWKIQNSYYMPDYEKRRFIRGGA